MNIYNLPLVGTPHTFDFQPIDLDYIVSIGKVDSFSYSPNPMQDCLSYKIYIKVGMPIEIMVKWDRGFQTPISWDTLEKNRQDLINAWKNKDNIQSSIKCDCTACVEVRHKNGMTPTTVTTYNTSCHSGHDCTCGTCTKARETGQAWLKRQNL